MARLLFGPHAGKAALAARPGELEVIYTTDAELFEAARTARVPCSRRTRRELDEMAGPGVRHQGAIAEMSDYRYADLEELLACERPLLIALDGVTDPQNL